MTFMFVSCINVRKVTVSSSLYTDQMLSSDVFFRLFFCECVGHMLHVQYVMNNSASLFPLHYVHFVFTFPPQPSTKTFLQYFDFFFQISDTFSFLVDGKAQWPYFTKLTYDRERGVRTFPSIALQL